MATLIFLLSIVVNPVGTVADVQNAQAAPAPELQQDDMRYYGVEQLLEKFEREA